MRCPDGIFLGACCQLIQSKFADRFQHPVTRLVGLRGSGRWLQPAHEALVDERRDPGKDVELRIALRIGNRFGSVEGETAHEDGQATEEHLLGWGEQIVAPDDGVAHRAQAHRCVPRSVGQERQRPVEPRQ